MSRVAQKNDKIGLSEAESNFREWAKERGVKKRKGVGLVPKQRPPGYGGAHL